MGYSCTKHLDGPCTPAHSEISDPGPSGCESPAVALRAGPQASCPVSVLQVPREAVLGGDYFLRCLWDQWNLH